ncbi:phosphate/sulfate permease [Bradyrhizobium sp. USDA 4501]
MKIDLLAYGVTELSPEEAAATLGGSFWKIFDRIVQTVVSVTTLVIGAVIGVGMIRGRGGRHL